MITRPDMLMIGATARNAGKTVLACELIRRHAATRTVVGIKVTTVATRDGVCPHGDKGCGVCTSPTGKFSIVEEHSDNTGKDTARMLRAGARRVFWLRVLRDHLAEGMSCLLDRVPTDAVMVCESNSARTVLEPGVFLVVREEGEATIKPSCSAVIAHADRIVLFNGAGWDFPPERIALKGNRWVVRPDATAIILAGGESRRMGSDKSMLALNGKPMIAHIADQLDFFPELLVSANNPAQFDFLGLPVVPDREPGQGPLMGILSCVARAAHDLCFVTGCDIPTIDPGFVSLLLAQAQTCDIVVPRHADGRIEPLLAVYRKSIIPVAEAALKKGLRRIIVIFDSLNVTFVPADQLDWYRNLNTMDDYRQWSMQATVPPEAAP